MSLSIDILLAWFFLALNWMYFNQFVCVCLSIYMSVRPSVRLSVSPPFSQHFVKSKSEKLFNQHEWFFLHNCLPSCVVVYIFMKIEHFILGKMPFFWSENSLDNILNQFENGSRSYELYWSFNNQKWGFFPMCTKEDFTKHLLSMYTILD